MSPPDDKGGLCGPLRDYSLGLTFGKACPLGYGWAAWSNGGQEAEGPRLIHLDFCFGLQLRCTGAKITAPQRAIVREASGNRPQTEERR